MMDAQLEMKLIECLGRLDDGEPIDRILAYYPDDAANLRQLLETATALEDLRMAPREPARVASRRAFLAHAYELREPVARRRSWLPRRLAIIVTALVAALIFMGGAVAASGSALPDQPLYGVKRAVEDARLLLVAGAEREQLAASFGQRRRDEINLLLDMRKDTVIAFEGMIERIQPNGWEVAGLYVAFDSATPIVGTPAVGSYARIQGHTLAGRLVADSISVEPGNRLLPGPTATATAQPRPTARPTTTSSPAPSPSPRTQATQRPQETPPPEATQPPTAMPTAAPTRVPTAAPRPRSTAAPTAAPPTAAPPTQEIDHSGSGGGDNGGDDHGGGGDNGGGDHGGGGDNGGGDHGGGDNGGGDHGGGNGGSGGGGGDNGGGDHGGGGGGNHRGGGNGGGDAKP